MTIFLYYLSGAATTNNNNHNHNHNRNRNRNRNRDNNKGNNHNHDDNNDNNASKIPWSSTTVSYLDLDGLEWFGILTMARSGAFNLM